MNEDNLMDQWTKGINKDELFSDQIQDDEAFTFEEPDIGLESLDLDTGEKGKSIDIKTNPKFKEQPKQTIDYDPPTVLSLESNNEAEMREIERKTSNSTLLDLIDRYGAGRGHTMWKQMREDLIRNK